MRPCWYGSAVGLFVLFFVLAGCAKTQMEEADAMRQQGDLEQALMAYSEVVKNPESDRELFRSYYWRAETHRELGNFQQAYADYYAAKLVSCMVAKTDRSGPGYSYGMIPSEYCSTWGDKKVDEVGSVLDPNQIEAARKQALSELPERFSE